jgi:hypothetical protein
LLNIYWNILTMHGPINVKSPNNTRKWQMGFNSAFKELNEQYCHLEALETAYQQIFKFTNYLI